MSEERKDGDLMRVQDAIALKTGQILVSLPNSISPFGSQANNQQQTVSKFSQEVAGYSTSSEVLLDLGQKVGKPRPGETESEFVDRASQALRKILKKKFKV